MPKYYISPEVIHNSFQSSLMSKIVTKETLEKFLQQNMTNIGDKIGPTTDTSFRFDYIFPENTESRVHTKKKNDDFELQDTHNFGIPIFEIETKEELNAQLLSTNSGNEQGLIKISIDALPEYKIINSFIPGYYNIGNDKYLKSELDEKANTTFLKKYGLFFVLITAITIFIPLITYAVHTWSQSQAKKLIRQASCYMDEKGKIYELMSNSNAAYWLKVQNKVTTLFNEAYRSLNIFFINEQEELEQDDTYYQKINNILEKLSQFGAGKIPTLEIHPNDLIDKNLFQAFQKTQEAHFILSLVAEMNIEGLDEVYSSEESKPLDWINFEKLFSSIRKKTEIKREIFNALIDEIPADVVFINDSPIVEENEYNNKYQLVTFGIQPNGQCVDYCLNMWDRKETIQRVIECLQDTSIEEKKRNDLKEEVLILIIDTLEDEQLVELREERTCMLLRKGKDSNNKLRELEETILKREKELTHYDQENKFIKFIQENSWDWLSNTFATTLFSIMKKGKKDLIIWGLQPNTHQLYFSTCSYEYIDSHIPRAHQRLHYLSTYGHATRMVEIDNFEELIAGKRHENRFKLFQNARQYNDYMNRWVDFQHPKIF